MRPRIFKIMIVLCLLMITIANAYENLVVPNAPELVLPGTTVSVFVEIENEFEIGNFRTSFILDKKGMNTSPEFTLDISPYPICRFSFSDCVDNLKCLGFAGEYAIYGLEIGPHYGMCIPSGPLEPQFLISIELPGQEGLVFIEPYDILSEEYWKWCEPWDYDCDVWIEPAGSIEIFAVYDNPNYVIRDCVDDWGAGESSIEDCEGFWASPDIWLGPVRDLFTWIPFGITCIHVSYYNNGWPTTPGHDVTVYFYVQRELGGETVGTTLKTITIPSVDHMISPSGSAGGSMPGHFIETSVWGQIDSDYDLCVLITSDEDPWSTNLVQYENNFAKHSMETLVYTPGGKYFDPSSSFLAYFSDTVEVANPLDTMATFLVKVENLDPGWEVMPADGFELMLGADETTEVSFFYERENAEHGDYTTADIILYQLPDSIILDGKCKRLWVDGAAPDSLPYFDVRLVDMPDSCPWPVYEINWDTPYLDTLGYQELLQGFEIHASTDSFDLHNLDSTTRIVRTNADFNLEQDDFQYYFVPPDSQVYYFTMFAIDAAEQTSKQTAILTGYEYECGDCNDDGAVNISDAVYVINYVFVGGDPPYPLYTADVNCDATVNISDAVWIINYVFVGGNAPCDSDPPTPNGDGIPDC